MYSFILFWHNLNFYTDYYTIKPSPDRMLILKCADFKSANLSAERVREVQSGLDYTMYHPVPGNFI